MEKIRNGIRILDDYFPFQGATKEQSKWEVLCFVYPNCNSTCAHCWSLNTFLGRVVSAEWHKSFWQKVDSSLVREVRLTGGEPFLHREIGKIINIVRSAVSVKVPILIFSNGRKFVSLKEGSDGIAETKRNLVKSDVILENVEIHLSADEHHAGSLYRVSQGIRRRPNSVEDIKKMNQLGIPLLQTQVKNFLAACQILSNGTKGRFRSGKLKIHVENDRLDFHRYEIFPWISNEIWDASVVSSEGLIKSGAAKKFDKASDIQPNSQVSLLLIPGAEFYQKPQTKRAQRYWDAEKQRDVFLDVSRDENHGASIVGWWNIINGVFCGGSVQDTLDLIGRQEFKSSSHKK